MSSFAANFSGAAAIVTGAASGIGFAIAQAFATAGAGVVMVDLDADALGRAVAKVAAGTAIGIAVDVSSSAAIAECRQQCVDAFGRVDVLVNNAGVFPVADLPEIDDAFFSRVFDTNLRSVLLLTRAFAPDLARHGHGSVINIASMDAFRPTFGGLTCYGASKAGVVATTQHLARELGPVGTRVNAVVPGMVLTEGGAARIAGLADEGREQLMESLIARIPLRRMATPEDIAPPALFLASSASAYMTGSSIVVDGGMLQG